MVEKFAKDMGKTVRLIIKDTREAITTLHHNLLTLLDPVTAGLAQTRYTYGALKQTYFPDGLSGGVYGKNRMGAALATEQSPKKQTFFSGYLEPLHIFLDIFSHASTSDVERAIDYKLFLYVVSLVASLVGLLFNPALLMLSLPIILYVSKDIVLSAYEGLVEERRINVDALAVILLGAMLYQGYFVVANVHIFIYLINRKLLSRTKRKSSAKLISIFQEQPQFVWVLPTNDPDQLGRLGTGDERQVAFDSLKKGDLVLVNAGESVPVDGKVVAGLGLIDQHMLTGESQPVEKGVDAQVFALTVVLSGKLIVVVEQAGEETAAAQIAEILNQTVNIKTGVQLWSERITNYTVVPTLAVAGAIWPMLGVESAMVLLNSHFRYRLNITSSTGVLAFLNLAAQKGLLIKDGRVFERLNQVDTIIFDKTGTLTEAQPYVSQIHTCSNYDAQTILQFTATVEQKQDHPIAKAILQAAMAQGLPLLTMDESTYHVGFGLTAWLYDGTVDERPCARYKLLVGSGRFIQSEGLHLPEPIHQAQQEAFTQGHSLVIVAIERESARQESSTELQAATDSVEVVGAIELQSTLRPDAQPVVQTLRKQYLNAAYIISGDQETPTQKLAQQIGVDQYFAETLPEDKAEVIKQLQKAGRTVCYVGDGLNDSIALKQADVSISLRGASTIATDTAQVILTDVRLENLVTLFALARKYRTNSRTIFASILVPSIVNIGAGLFFDLSLLYSVLLTAFSGVLGFTNALAPLVKHQDD
ncbi:MAG: heavy metal translocating P-type ATPase [Chloroflexota bacterium]